MNAPRSRPRLSPTACALGITVIWLFALQLQFCRSPQEPRREPARTRPAPTPAPPLALDGLPALALEVLGLVNADRAAAGAGPLDLDGQLLWVADWRANSMAARGVYTHQIGPDGSTVGDLLGAFGGPNACGAGESIWKCHPRAPCGPELIHATFSGSPPHRRNQENARWTHFGFGTAEDEAGFVLVVELFSDQTGCGE